MLRQQTTEPQFLYPPPPIDSDAIYGVVVEKNCDETGTSMRLKELYGYSNSIIIRDGYMVLPKLWFKDLVPGDWFRCIRIFSKDRFGNEKEERELENMHKISKDAYKALGLPPTRCNNNGVVQIARAFMLCPDFIRNRFLKNSNGDYRKLIIMDMGQGFVHSRNPMFKKIDKDTVYTGIFEFRGKDNGGVNFAWRTNEIRDMTGHVLERDALWELHSLSQHSTEVRLDKHEAMKDHLQDLLKSAKAYDKELHAKGFYNAPIQKESRARSRVPNRPRARAGGDFARQFEKLQIAQKDQNFNNLKLARPMPTPNSRFVLPLRSKSRGDFPTQYHDESTMRASQMGSRPVRNLSERRSSPMPNNETWIEQSTFQPVPRNRLASDISLLNITAADHKPIATSTPMGSPERRAFPLPPNIRTTRYIPEGRNTDRTLIEENKSRQIFNFDR